MEMGYTKIVLKKIGLVVVKKNKIVNERQRTKIDHLSDLGNLISSNFTNRLGKKGGNSWCRLYIKRNIIIIQSNSRDKYFEIFMLLKLFTL